MKPTGGHARELLDAAPALIFTATADGGVDDVNRRWTEYTGLPLEAALGSGWLSVVHPEDVERVRDVWSVAVAKRAPLDLQLRFRRSDGAFRWHHIRTVPVQGDGQPGWVGTSFDIDRQKRIEQSLQFLAKANEILSSSLDPEATLQHVVDVCVPEIADSCSVHLNRGGHPVLAAIRHVNPVRMQALAEVLRDYPPDERLSITAVIRSGRPQVITNITRDVLARRAQSPRHLELLESLGLHEVAVYPMTAEGRVLGAISLGISESPRTFTPADLQVASLLSARAGVAIANAALFESERHAVGVLQRSLLPAALPPIPGAALDACYVSGESAWSVGGDWYDAFLLDERRLFLSIGDVSGKGLEAATAMGRVRDSLRAAAYVEDDPARALAVADELFREGGELFVTCFAAIFDVETHELRYANAGHHAPRLRDADGNVASLAQDGLPLGLRWAADEPRRQHRIALEPGSLLVLFTDGLVEQAHDPARDLARLEAILTTTSYEARTLRDTLVRLPSKDDVAILTLFVKREVADD